jgi:hypothetical protein
LLKKTVRLKITDFIESPIEDSVMSFLQMIGKDSPTFNVMLWYERNSMDTKSLLSFRKKYHDAIEELEIDITEIVGVEKSVWYDIVNTGDQERLQHYKFRSVYETTDDIINCIMEFNSMIKFDTQKNNGYRNAKDRNHRFKTVGKQTKD